MKHIFIENPCAGNGKGLKMLREKIAALEDGEIVSYETGGRADATRFVQEYCEAHPTEEKRFYACGGDGTLSEVAAGLLGQKNASLACVPIGSGNDFVKYFGGKEKFSDLETLMTAPTEAVDVIALTLPGGACAYSLNVCNFGFDAFVAGVMAKVRRTPLLGGKNAYTTGIVAALFRAMRNQAKIYADGELLFDDEQFLLCTVSNASHVGGSYCCAPRADVCDGWMEVCAVRPISLFRLLTLIGVYQKGTHLDDPRFADILAYRRARRVEVVFPRPAAVCLDGELIETDRFTAEILPGAVEVALPGSKKKGEIASQTQTVYADAP